MTEPVGLARGLTNYGDPDFALYLRRSFARSMGYSTDLLARPVIGIADTFSGFNNCHRHFPELIEAVKRGVLATGGLPLTFPTISLGEVFLSPTSLMFRNLMAIDTEEMIRAQPMDAVVLVGGCDKTVPAQLMGAISANRPAIQLVAGPMLTSRWHGERLGACTDCRRFWAKYRAGEIDADEIHEIEGNLATTAGTCAVMGTASTMASIAEALGMILPGSAAIPAVHADRLRAAEATGRAAMQLAARRADPGPDRHAAIGRERAARADGDRRLDQCGLAPDRDRRARRRRHRSRPAQRDQRHDAGAGRSEADRPALHGGSVRRRRHRRGAARAAAAAAPRLPDGRRRDLGGAPRRAGRPGRPRRSSSRLPIRCSRRAGSSRCSARWRRRARSSSARPPTRNCSRRRAAPSSSPRSRTSRRASTIPSST